MSLFYANVPVSAIDSHSRQFLKRLASFFSGVYSWLVMNFTLTLTLTQNLTLTQTLTPTLTLTQTLTPTLNPNPLKLIIEN